MKRHRVYIGGKLSDAACGYIRNCHKMIEVSIEARLSGLAPYTPAEDLLSGLVSGQLNYSDFFDVSVEFLKVCEGMILVPGWQTSVGVAKEIEIAKQYHIPIFYSVEEAVNYFNWRYGEFRIPVENARWPLND